MIDQVEEQLDSHPDPQPDVGALVWRAGVFSFGGLAIMLFFIPMAQDISLWVPLSEETRMLWGLFGAVMMCVAQSARLLNRVRHIQGNRRLHGGHVLPLVAALALPIACLYALVASLI